MVDEIRRSHSKPLNPGESVKLGFFATTNKVFTLPATRPFVTVSLRTQLSGIATVVSSERALRLKKFRNQKITKQGETFQPTIKTKNGTEIYYKDREPVSRSSSITAGPSLPTTGTPR